MQNKSELQYTAKANFLLYLQTNTKIPRVWTKYITVSKGNSALPKIYTAPNSNTDSQTQTYHFLNWLLSLYLWRNWELFPLIWNNNQVLIIRTVTLWLAFSAIIKAWYSWYGLLWFLFLYFVDIVVFCVLGLCVRKLLRPLFADTLKIIMLYNWI